MANNVLQECTAASQNDLKHASAVLYLHASELADGDDITELITPFTPRYLEAIPLIDRSKQQVRSKRVLTNSEKGTSDNQHDTSTVKRDMMLTAMKRATEGGKGGDKGTGAAVKTELVMSYEGLEEIIRVNLDLTANIFSDVLLRRVWTTLENGYEEVKVHV